MSDKRILIAGNKIASALTELASPQGADQVDVRQRYLVEVYPTDWPAPPKGSTPNKYQPHQGSREMRRRAKRLAQPSPLQTEE